jgi:hypothetical protein
VNVPRNQAPQFLAKAVEFASAARGSLERGDRDAAMLNAIHAGICAADAVCVALAAQRSTDPDHARAADLLEEVAASSSDVKERARQLRRLLAKKNAVEYESRRATSREASDATDRAERLIGWAKEVVASVRG